MYTYIATPKTAILISLTFHIHIILQCWENNRRKNLHSICFWHLHFICTHIAMATSVRISESLQLTLYMYTYIAIAICIKWLYGFCVQRFNLICQITLPSVLLPYEYGLTYTICGFRTLSCPLKILNWKFFQLIPFMFKIWYIIVLTQI